MSARFAAKCETQSNGCIYWTGARDGCGYGLFRVNRERIERAHRVALRSSGVEVGPADVVMHACDTPWCVNPQHLSIGTRATNNADRDRKGRHVALRGMQHGSARFSPEDVLSMRASTESNRALGRIHNCAAGVINNIRKRRTWKHI